MGTGFSSSSRWSPSRPRKVDIRVEPFKPESDQNNYCRTTDEPRHLVVEWVGLGMAAIGRTFHSGTTNGSLILVGFPQRLRKRHVCMLDSLLQLHTHSNARWLKTCCTAHACTCGRCIHTPRLAVLPKVKNGIPIICKMGIWGRTFSITPRATIRT